MALYTPLIASYETSEVVLSVCGMEANNAGWPVHPACVVGIVSGRRFKSVVSRNVRPHFFDVKCGRLWLSP
jgi:hypothetical protein